MDSVGGLEVTCSHSQSVPLPAAVDAYLSEELRAHSRKARSSMILRVIVNQSWGGQTGVLLTRKRSTTAGLRLTMQARA